jgi:hypothetical protein
LIVSEVGDGKTATDLGINKSVASAVLNGDAVFEITGDFTLDQINDGNGLRLLESAPDIQITLTDDTVLEINLDGIVNLNDFIDKINDHEDNDGKVSASLNAGRLELNDLSGGGGSSSFTVENINDTSVVRQLGLDVAAVGSTISGRRLAAGINSVLLSNLRGGRGIDELGQLTLTDRAGVTATIDLAGAESLGDVTDAINAAESLSSVKLQLSARINAAGTGIEIEDTSGLTANNLVIQDVGTSTLAAQLGIAIDAAQDSVDSGRLNLRYVNESTSLKTMLPTGAASQRARSASLIRPATTRSSRSPIQSRTSATSSSGSISPTESPSMPN